MHNLWQLTIEQAEALAQWLLGTDLPKGVRGIPYEAPSCHPSPPPPLAVDARQIAGSWYFEGCNKQVGIRAIRGQVAWHFLLGHKWPN